MKLTVALPVYSGKDITWLCLESLKRQRDVDFEWELVVFEEEHGQQLGEKYFQDNRPTWTKYITDKRKHTLGEKWFRIVQESSEWSEVIVFCAADNYYHPYMLRDSLDAINRGVDWFYTVKGFFYDFGSEKIILYSARKKTGLQMAASLDIAKKIPNQPRRRLVDKWLRSHMRPQNPGMDMSGHWQGTLFTHGYNIISSKRGEYFHNPKYPFRKVDERLEEIVPQDITKRIKSMR